MPTKQQLGERIKRVRLERNLTLKDVEVRAKVSATHVSEIERGMTSPTVGALTKIARALGTEPSYFIQSDTYPSCSIVRNGDRLVLDFADWGARIHRLSTGIRNASMSFLEMELTAGAAGSDAPAITHNGEELIHILKGVVEVRVGDDRHLLKEGDSIHFRSSKPHSIRNIGDGTSRVLCATSPPFYL